jgi:ethanolamine ammonia-lyase large subunit
MVYQRRTFLRDATVLSASLATLPALSARSAMGHTEDSVGIVVPQPLDGEDLVAYMRRLRGAWDEQLYTQLLGAANDFKEGDAIVGIAAADDASRRHARTLLANTAIGNIDQHLPHRDHLASYITELRPASPRTLAAATTLGQLKAFLLEQPEAEIHAIKSALSSDVIACVVKLMSNAELIAVSSKLYNALPESRIGARGYLGARIQPNSPTDHPDDIRWQVFDGFAYAVGDVLVGTNPVSSNPESVLAVELVLKDILTTFGIDDLLPHCVLAHIDVQAEVERDHPGSTELWFQSIAGNDAANKTFDVSVQRLRQYARTRTGRFGLYFETGQGADFTNGHAYGCDMVLLESRKYGLARSLSCEVAEVTGGRAWVHVNDVAGFIGPEVFRSREQLVRCCLEDLVMGKLHGLTIGLDVCSTLHMDVTLDDLDWCLEQIAPAMPAYLMALPTKIDPMLGYLTTGFQDHVRLRENLGLKVNDGMQRFFEDLQVVDAAGQPTEHFGDPVWVYLQYCRRKGDLRPEGELRAEAEQQLAATGQRGVFIARGYGDRPSALSPKLASEIRAIYDDAKVCIWEEWQDDFVRRIPNWVHIQSQSVDRTDYIWHPESGEKLSESAVQSLLRLRDAQAGEWQAQFVISEGLNALALMDDGNLFPLLEAIRSQAASRGLAVAPEHVVVTGGRVRAGYRIGELLFGGLGGERTLLHVVGERPGSGHRTLSVYLTRATGEQWQSRDFIDHNITRVVSGIATTALLPELAAKEVGRLL